MPAVVFVRLLTHTFDHLELALSGDGLEDLEFVSLLALLGLLVFSDLLVELILALLFIFVDAFDFNLSVSRVADLFLLM